MKPYMYVTTGPDPLVTVVIPTVTGREASLMRCMASYIKHTPDHDLQLLVYKDLETCGEAWREGAERAYAPYIHFSADDLEVTHSDWSAVAIEAVDNGLMPSPIIRHADGRLDYGSRTDDHHQPWPDWTFTAFSVIPFLNFEMFEKIGVPDLHYHSDTWIGTVGLELGWETVIRHGYEFVHHYATEGRYETGPRMFADKQVYKRLFVEKLGGPPTKSSREGQPAFRST